MLWASALYPVEGGLDHCPYVIPRRILGKEPLCSDRLRSCDVKHRLNGSVVRAVLRRVYPAPHDRRRRQLFRGQYRVDCGLAPALALPLGPLRQQTTEPIPCSLISSLIGSACPCLFCKSSSPPYSWLCRLKSPASNTSARVVPRFAGEPVQLVDCIASTSASSFCPSTYTDTTSTDRSGSRSTAAVRPDDCTGTCSALISFRIYSMLRNTYLPCCCILGTTFVRFKGPIGTVTPVFLIIACLYSSDITGTLKSLGCSLFIRLYYTIYCFRTFS